MKPTKFKNLVYLDVETYFDREYSLGKMTMTEYIRDPRFKLHSIQMAINDGEIQYFDTDHIEDALVLLRNLDNWALVAQNTAFDAAILNWRCGVKPSFYYDTMSMSRGFWPTESASLKELAIRLFPDDNTMRKGDELINFLGVETLTPEQHVVMARYGNQDVHLTREIFKKLIDYGYPKEELYQIHMVIRMYVEPSFVIDRPLLEQAIEEDVHETQTAIEKALTQLKQLCSEKGTTVPYAFDEKLFSSNQRFADVLKTILGIEPPIKLNPKGAPTYAFGKNDVPFIKMRDDYPEFEAIFDARELVKSTIAASRAATMLRCSEPSELNHEGRLPVPLKYYGAATGRYSGQDKINLQNLQRGSKHRLSLTAPENHYVYVADSSNIEARVNAWFAGQTDLVEAFRQGADIYSNFATEVVFGYPVNKDLKHERGVGKVCILGLGYGMGWRTFQRTLQSGPMGMAPMPCSDDFAQKCTYGYREKYPMITQNWQIANSMIAQMLDPACNMQWGHLRVLHNCILMPNGLWLSYPGLRMQQMEHANGIDTWYEYWNGKFWKKLYGGLLIENCLAGDTEVLTNSGWKQIKDVMKDDLVFDGVEFVQHQGVKQMGVKDTIEVDGVRMTPEHRVLTNEGWKEASQLSELHWDDYRVLNISEATPQQWKEMVMAVSMPVWESSSKNSIRANKNAEKTKNAKTDILWVHDEGGASEESGSSINTRTPNIPRLEDGEESLYKSIQSRIQKLWWSWNNVQRGVDGFQSILQGYDSHMESGFAIRQDGQQQRVLETKLQMGNTKAEREQQTEFSTDMCWEQVANPAGVRERVQCKTFDDIVQTSEGDNLPRTSETSKRNEPVYDIINCGPRNMFVVRGGSSLMVAHNCCQATAGLIIKEAMNRVDKWLVENDLGRIVLQVHDEIICVARNDRPAFPPEVIQQTIQDMMCVNPTWALDIPLAAEGGFANEYSK